MVPRVAWVVVGLVVVAGALVGTLFLATPGPRTNITPPANATTAPQNATTQANASPSATAPTTPATKPTVKTYLDLVAALNPGSPTLEPLKAPLAFSDAATLLLQDEAYVDPMGDLWLRHPDAPPISAALKDANKSQTHVSSDEVVYVYWSRNAQNNRIPQVITQRGRSFFWTSPSSPSLPAPIELSRTDYRFEAAQLLLDQRIVVPTTEGIAVLTPPANASAPPTELFHPLPSGTTPVAIFLVPGGAVAFRPWDNGDPGSDLPDAAIWLTPDGFKPLPQDYLPPKPMHLIALTDGSNLILSVGDDASLEVEFQPPLTLPPGTVQPEIGRLATLVQQLSTGSDRQRIDAQTELARYGPSAWPVLEGMRDAASPEGQLTIDRLLGARAKPTLGIFTLLPGPVRVIARTRDNALALQTFGGVNYLDLGLEKLRSPALLLVRPGRPTVLAHESLAQADRAAGPGKLEFQLTADDVFVTDSLRGTLRLAGNRLVPVLAPELSPYRTFVALDRASRSLFQNPRTKKFLLIDPYLPSPAPRLPAWTMTITGGQTGWDADNYPVIQKGGAWRLEATAWKALPKGTAPLTDAASPNAPNRPGESDALRLLQGTSGLRSLSTRPESTVLTIPSGKRFVFTRPGTIVRYSPPPDSKVEATFTEDIPSENIRRIWLDPLGRICIAHADDQLTILFPAGYIPPELSSLITRNEKKK